MPSSVFSQDDFYHPELEWQSIETAHFKIHFHGGAERSARAVAKIAEEIYDPITSLYNHKPDQKVSFIIKDFEDISNGAAYFYDNKVEIWAPSMDFDLRGTHNWLRNVVTHEFTHIVQIQTTMKFGRTMPGIYLQWLGYESERRPDVLYGFPNIIASYPLSGFVVPVWFAEGVAQYNRGELRYDFWDSHRDMILRSYALDSNMLTWEQMGVFGKTSLGNESSYNAGFAFVSYVAKKYGDEKLNEISRNLARIQATRIDDAIELALGKSGAEVYNEWRVEVERDYAERVASIRSNIREGERIPLINDEGEQETESGTTVSPTSSGHRHGVGPAQGVSLECCKAAFHTGFANLHPSYSPDGKKIAYLTTKRGDYFGQSALYVYDVETQKEKRLQAGVRTGISWSPDGKKLFYGKSSRKNPFWSLLFDLYEYDIDKEEETRLTQGKRAMSPAVSPDGSHVVFAVSADGTSNLAITKIDGSDYRLVTSYLNGEQVYSPRWSPAGDRILFDYSIKDGRDLAWVKPDGSDIQFLVTGSDDSRSGAFTADGSKIVFSSDRTGIFNLYRYVIATGVIEQLTNVLGGAFMPTVSPSGDIVYASYTSSGYKIVRLKDSSAVAAGDHRYQQSSGESSTPAGTNGKLQQFDWNRLRSYDDTQLPALSARPYRNVFTSLAIVPFVRVDNYNTSDDALDAIKPGVYLFSQDVLDKLGMFASIALNKRLERDLYLQFAYRGRVPLFFQLGLEPVIAAELYNVTRTTDNFIELPEATIPVEVSYNLLEFDFVMTQPFLSQGSNVEFRFAHSRYTSIIEAFYNPIGGQLIPGSSDLYLVANDLSLKFTINGIAPTRTSEINPVGGKIIFRIGRELNKFNGDGDYTVGSTGLIPLYKYINFTRTELRWRQHIPALFKDHTITASFRGGSILEKSVDDFFDFYAGGLLGMRGYPFYAIGGNEMAVAGLEYRFPLVHNIDVRLLHLYFDKLYASVFADIGNAWTGKSPNLRQFKTDIGAELRLEAFSWYAYPTRIFFSGAYGFDKFDRFIASRNQTVTYGKEWRFYLGVLFGFDFD
ncbi:MAG: BamA/TamA family outer membrane protein [Bacteroidota bacterium]